MAIFHGIEDTQYGPKVLLDLQKGKGIKRYNITPEAQSQTMQMAPNTTVYPVWAADNEKPDEFPLIKSFSSTPPPKKTGSGFKGQKHEYDPKTFVSNVVGQAIAAKAIENPSQIKEWAKAAWDAINGLDSVQQKVETVRQAAVQAQPQNNTISQDPDQWRDDIDF